MDWTHYLQSIREDSDRKDSELFPSRKCYTITTVEGEIPKEKPSNAAFSDFDLMVQLLEEEEDAEGNKKKEKQVEQLGVLDGLRKYAKEHVLLQGKPGSGKSTALKRLLLEEAETSERIPVLVELKLYKESIIGLIREFLGQHKATLLDTEIIEALDNGVFFLLIDGVNELPSEKARRELESFRRSYQSSTPMIFTTRDLGLGGNLGIEKKLEMLPLSESQMREFIFAYSPETGEQMFASLKDRLREFGKTPLFLKMLCVLYREKQEIPENLGLIFRAFVKNYEENPKHKGNIPLEITSKSFWGDLLKEIAFRMMQGDDDPKEIAMAIPKSEAVKVIWNFCKGANLPNSLRDAQQWLDELLKHHLIELEGRDQITFCHQLIQEYYAAEKLLKLLPELDNWSLKWDYLNYLKWTETFKIICSLFDDKKQALEIINIASEIDIRLSEELFKSLNLFPTKKQKNKSLSFTNKCCGFIVDNQRGIDITSAASILSKDYQFNIEKRISRLINELNFSNNFHKRMAAAHSLGSLDFDEFRVVDSLISGLYDTNMFVRLNSAEALGKLEANQATASLIKLLSESNYRIRVCVVGSLGRIRSKQAINALIESLSDTDIRVRLRTIETLGEIGCSTAIPSLINFLYESNYDLRNATIKALGKLGSQETIPFLLNWLTDSDPELRRESAFLLGKISSKQIINPLITAFLSPQNSGYDIIRAEIIRSLGTINDDLVIKILIKALSDSYHGVQMVAAQSLGNLASEEAVKELGNLVFGDNSYVSWRAAQALEEIGTEQSLEQLRNKVYPFLKERSKSI